MKVLFLVPYPTEGASNRMRVEQFIPYLEARGIVCKVRPFVNRRFFRILYRPGCLIEKTFWFIVCTVNRIFDLMRTWQYDLVFIHREAYPFGDPFLEIIIHKMGKPIVFDFDDAIFLHNTSKENRYINKLKKPDKVSRIIEMSRLVIAGNDYLKEFALKFNRAVVRIPTSVDTEKYAPGPEAPDKKNVTIGWVGSSTTIDFLTDIEGALAELSRNYANLVINIVGAEFSSDKVKNVINKKWSLDSEISDIQNFDIGIMPLPDTEWAKGKCAFKAILYMACGVPVVASPVGVNLEILDDGASGLFARTNKDWVNAISKLIEDRRLRQAMGKVGRKKVIEKYSVAATAPLFYESLIKAKRQ